MELIRDTINLDDYMTDAPADHRVLPASDWVSEVIDHFHKPDESPKVRLPWRRTHGDFHLRTGEVSLWAGINGHGKSQVIGQVIHGLNSQGQRVALASLEMRPVATMGRMTRQAYGADMPPAAYIQKFGTWTDGKLWIYDHMGSVNAQTMLAVIRYTVDKFDVHHFVVDNLMKCGMGEDAYTEQKMFVDGLCVIAKDTGCHIHLVLHIVKLKDESALPNKFNIKGSGTITDLVDNIFIVWRNKAKESAFRSGDAFEPEEPDCLLVLDKQRHGEGVEGKYKLFFDPASMQYMEDRHAQPIHCKAEIGVSLEDIQF